MAQGQESSGSNGIEGLGVPPAQPAGASLADARESTYRCQNGRLKPAESDSLPSSHKDRAGGSALAGEKTINGRTSAVMENNSVSIWPRHAIVVGVLSRGVLHGSNPAE